MISIRVENDGKCSCHVDVKGLARLTAQAFIVVNVIYDTIDEIDHEDAERFKEAFYKAADERKLFDSEEDTEKKGKTDEEELKDNLVRAGASEEIADELVELAVRLRKVLEDACDD